MLSNLKKLTNLIVRLTDLSKSPRNDKLTGEFTNQMAKITIDGTEYETDNLSENAKNQLSSLQFATSERQRLEALLAVTKTAQVAYSNAFKDEVNQSE